MSCICLHHRLHRMDLTNRRCPSDVSTVSPARDKDRRRCLVKGNNVKWFVINIRVRLITLWLLACCTTYYLCLVIRTLKKWCLYSLPVLQRWQNLKTLVYLCCKNEYTKVIVVVPWVSSRQLFVSNEWLIIMNKVICLFLFAMKVFWLRFFETFQYSTW